VGYPVDIDNARACSGFIAVGYRFQSAVPRRGSWVVSAEPFNLFGCLASRYRTLIQPWLLGSFAPPGAGGLRWGLWRPVPIWWRSTWDNLSQTSIPIWPN